MKNLLDVLLHVYSELGIHKKCLLFIKIVKVEEETIGIHCITEMTTV
jgi:hypothetical protein